MRLAVAAIVLATLAVAAGVARSSIRAWRFVHPTRTRVTGAATAKARAELPGLEEVTLHTADGLALRGWFSPGTNRGVVIFVHGLFGNRMSLEPEAHLISSHGYGVLLYDSRASGESDGKVATWGDQEQLDTRAAVDYVAGRPEIDPARIAMLGFSVGGSTVALSGAFDPRVRAVILHATWTSLEHEMRANHGELGPVSWVPTLLTMRLVGIDPGRVTPLEHIARIAPRPLLMIAGAVDRDTPLVVMRRLFRAAGDPKELWIVPGSDHGGYVAAGPAEYEARVTAFLDRALMQ